MVPAQLKYNRNKTVKQIPLRDDEIVSFQLSNDTREIKHWNVSALDGVHMQNCMSETAKKSFTAV